jgi:hypothetical protein
LFSGAYFSNLKVTGGKLIRCHTTDTHALTFTDTDLVRDELSKNILLRLVLSDSVPEAIRANFSHLESLAMM